MYLEAPNVFLDTEAFVSANHNVDSRKFQIVRAHVRDGHIRLYLTDIVVRETRRRIQIAVERAFHALAKIRDECRALNNVESVYQTLDRDRMPEYTAHLLDRFHRFIDECVSEIVPCAAVPVSSVLDAYFSGKPPFGTERKRYEFPDAISVLSIALWADEKKTKAVVVSGDDDIADLIETFGLQGRLFRYRSLEDLITRLVARKELETEVAELIMSDGASFLMGFVRDWVVLREGGIGNPLTELDEQVRGGFDSLLWQNSKEDPIVAETSS